MITEIMYECQECTFTTEHEHEADDHSAETDHAVMDYEYVDWPEPSKTEHEDFD